MYSVRHPARRYDREYIAYPISVFSLCVACSICRCGSGGRHGGFCFFSFPAVSMISRPHPPAPLPPPGKGESQSLFRRGLRPRHPCTEPSTALADAAMQVPGGGLPGRSPARPTFSFISFPHPPSPPFPTGRGLLVFICKGLRPLHPRARAESGTGCTCVAGARRWLARQVAGSPCLKLYWLPPSPLPPFPLRGRGSLKVYFAGGFAPGTPALNRLRHLQTLPYRCPAGGLPGRSPGRPALSFIGCPHPPPAPLPVGKGAFSFLMQGASPLASPGAESMVCCKPDRKQFPASGAARVQPPGTTAAKSISAANGLMPGCRGRSPRRNKLIVSPFPAGEGGRGG